MPGPLGGPKHGASLPEAPPTLSWAGSRGGFGRRLGCDGASFRPLCYLHGGPCSYTSQARPTSLSPDMPSWGGHR